MQFTVGLLWVDVALHAFTPVDTKEYNMLTEVRASHAACSHQCDKLLNERRVSLIQYSQYWSICYIAWPASWERNSPEAALPPTLFHTQCWFNSDITAEHKKATAETCMQITVVTAGAVWHCSGVRIRIARHPSAPVANNLGQMRRSGVFAA
jgi:hypothetical protein